MPRKSWDKDLARQMYDSGATDREIAKAVHVSLCMVYNWRKEETLPPHRKPRFDAKKARELYDQGFTRQ